MSSWSFEQGPIRPPSEAASLLLRFTRNCPWNKCGFCSVYKGRTFSRRSLQEIQTDIEAVRQIIDHLRAVSKDQGHEGEIDRQVFGQVMGSPEFSHFDRQVAAWLARGKGQVFLQDANSIIMKTKDLAQALRFLRSRIPEVKRVTTYARSSTVVRKSDAEMQTLHQAGLDRIHIGMESGSNQVLGLIHKGVSAETQIAAGQKVVRNGLSLSEYIMPGLGGQELAGEHARETTAVLNGINPDYIRLRTLRVLPGTPLAEMQRTGRFHPLPEDDILREIRFLVQNLDVQGTRIVSDHMMNLLQEVEGTLPADREAMLGVIDSYLHLSPEDRLLFRLGRRGGGLTALRDLNDPGLRARLEQAKQDLERRTGQGLQSLLETMVHDGV